MLAVRHLSTKGMDGPMLFRGLKSRDGGGCLGRGGGVVVEEGGKGGESRIWRRMRVGKRGLNHHFGGRSRSVGQEGLDIHAMAAPLLLGLLAMACG